MTTLQGGIPAQKTADTAEWAGEGGPAAHCYPGGAASRLIPDMFEE